MADVKNYMVGNDQNTIDQIKDFASSEAYKDSKIRIMPDAHAGKGAVVGSTITFKDKIVPATVGVDIACRVSLYPLGKMIIDWDKFDQEVRKKVPTGFNVRPEQSKFSIDFPYEDLHCWNKLKNHERLQLSMGTLGAGNHMVELDIDRYGNYWLLIHTGSRNLGLQVANYYQNLAIKNCEGKDIPKDLCYIDGKDMRDYLDDMKICNEFSHYSHRTIYNEIIGSNYYGGEITCIHNYVDTDMNIIRKGAIAAYAGDIGIIPLNMRDGVLLVEAKGNIDWNCSLPHGAGRIMSRTQAKKNLNLKDFEDSMMGIHTSSIGESTIDEAPMVYKDAAAIEQAIKPNADIIYHMKPIWNYKAI